MSGVFKFEVTTIKVLAHCCDVRSDNGIRTETVDQLIIMSYVGSETKAARMMAYLSERYVGKPIHLWELESTPAVEIKL